MSHTVDRTLADFLRELVGLKCEAADNPLGSVIRFDLGPMGLGPLSGPRSKPHGWRHLTVESPWRLQTDRHVLCDWNAQSGTGGAIESVVKQLVGEVVESATAEAPAWDLEIRWSNGVGLIIFSDSTEDREEAWSILGTDGLILEAGPSRQGEAGWSVRWEAP
jgi:hypothetical protein